MRHAVAVALAAAALATSAAAAIAAADSARAGTAVEGWYTLVPACTPTIDCSSLPTVTPYPEHTLHVAATAGTPSAATYVELALPVLPDGVRITGGTLHLPVDTTPADGSVAAETAKLVVCAVTGLVEPAAGSTHGPPETDCAAASSPASYTANPRPTFTADLTPFASRWAEGERPALAVLPASEAQTERQTWHVTFWGRESGAPDAAPITADLTLDRDRVPDGPASVPGTGPGVLGGGRLPAAEDVPSPPLGGAPSPPVTPPTALRPSTLTGAPAQAVSSAATAPGQPGGYAYPIALLMPLALAAGLLGAGRALTTTLTPRTGT